MVIFVPFESSDARAERPYIRTRFTRSDARTERPYIKTRFTRSDARTERPERPYFSGNSMQ